MTTYALKYGRMEAVELPDPVRTIDGALGNVGLHVAANGRRYVTYQEWRYETPRERVPTGRILAEPIDWHTGPWPGPRRCQCHTVAPSHPWNEGKPHPGHHVCAVCGDPAWIESHGNAAGSCMRCGHSG